MNIEIKKQIEQIISIRYFNKFAISIDETLFQLNFICHAIYNKEYSHDSTLAFNIIFFDSDTIVYRVIFQESPSFDFMPEVIWTQI